MLEESQIIKNWDRFIDQLDISLSDGDRKKILIDFYEQFSDRFSTMPASGNIKFHSAFPGGYIDHVLGVFNCAISVKSSWILNGAFTQDFTDEELFFTVLNHDLGKFGTIQHEYYIPQESKWHRDRGEVYTRNPALSFMKTSDRSLFILQELGVKLSETEYLAIKLHDGLYEDSNKSYLVSYSDDYRLRSNLSYILHQADLMSARIEYDKANRFPPNEFKKVKIDLPTSDLKSIVFKNDESKPEKKIQGKYAHLLNKK